MLHIYLKAALAETSYIIDNKGYNDVYYVIYLLHKSHFC